VQLDNAIPVRGQRVPPDRAPADLPVVVDLAMSLRACLDGQLVGLYLCGSAVSGDFDVNASDLDVIAVTTCHAGDLDLRRIGKALARIERRHPAWAGRIEVAHVGKGTLQSSATEDPSSWSALASPST
jgi:hypothetical protein